MFTSISYYIYSTKLKIITNQINFFVVEKFNIYFLPSKMLPFQQIINMQKVNIAILFLMLYITINASNLIRLPIKGNFHEGYQTIISFGSERIPTSMLVDTGSSLSVLQCRNCQKCNSKGNIELYSFEQSMTSKKISCASRDLICQGRCRSNQQFCEYKVQYAQGTSVYGDIIRDQIYIGNETAELFKGFFGCIDFQKNIHEESTNIMGLAPTPKENMLYSLFQSNQKFQYQFSTCFAKEGGYLQVGRDINYESKKPTWTSKIYTNSGYYILENFESIKFSSFTQTSDKLPKGMLIDTGSSLYIFPQPMFEKISQQINSRCQRLGGKCTPVLMTDDRILIGMMGYKSYNMVQADLDKNFQKLELTINGVKTSNKPSEYFQLEQETNGNFLLRASFGSLKASGLNVDRSIYQQIILGMVWLRNKKIVFNLKEQTIKAYYDEDCTYTPVPVEYDSSLEETVMIAWNYLKTVQPSYLALACIIVVILAVTIKKNTGKMAKKCCNLKQSIVNIIASICKSKKKKIRKVRKVRKNDKSQIQLNEQSYRQQQKGSSELQRQKPTVPKALKKRLRGRSLKKKQQNI